MGGQAEMGGGVGQNGDVEKFPGGSDVWEESEPVSEQGSACRALVWPDHQV